jgi:hypothetical protein
VKVVTRRRGREKLRFRKEGTVERVFEIYIEATPERLWQAIAEPGQQAG